MMADNDFHDGILLKASLLPLTLRSHTTVPMSLSSSLITSESTDRQHFCVYFPHREQHLHDCWAEGEFGGVTAFVGPSAHDTRYSIPI